MDDLQLRQNILDELEFDPSVNAAHIGVIVDNGVVTITGHVCSYLEELAVVRAVQGVKGVRAIAQEIEVRLPKHVAIADDEIAAHALNVLRLDSIVPIENIQIAVRDGRITLTGEVCWHFQRKAAEEDVCKLAGVAGVFNHIKIHPVAPAGYVSQQIEDALKRSAEIEAKGIKVKVDEAGKAVVEGSVRHWKERDAVERAVLSAPGITAVENRIMIT
jgi:osmotically-inducible protein OsmY